MKKQTRERLTRYGYYNYGQIIIYGKGIHSKLYNVRAWYTTLKKFKIEIKDDCRVSKINIDIDKIKKVTWHINCFEQTVLTITLKVK